ncbi:DNA helicase [Longispora fulva]|uniref:DNA 3'-5' helicase n=1 Tax=Longispora fulva TaxID=619741 RepID=A0A8J7GG45_9ACTN|nr:UvrD-helicase domain-containing protein [Longispora fulva]MBG6138324.1 superfamily I DNA/RNA helicase/mRNA-degrading endonuclease RelE of RelBE toxin-antitoxin system [Longispora fulva]GIG60577.1 DNA helicase [Longispora fulva]
MSQGVVTLRILERADKEILKLSRTEKGAIWEFQSKFRQNPDSPGLRLKQLKGDSRLWSARVSADYRALLLSVGDGDYLLVSVKHRKDVYDNLDRYAYQINRVTGGIEVIDLAAVGDSLVGRLIPATEPEESPEIEARGLFARFSDQELLDLGVAEALLASIARVSTEDDLLALVECVPQLTADVLLALHEGKTLEEVLEQVTAPVASEEPVDQEDYAAAVLRPATQVTTDDAALQAILAESFARWQVFLHPTQRKLVERDYTGPARVGGGPGTGKTIVALHRVKHLALELAPGNDRPILLTTFNRNLAADLRERLLALGGPELVTRVDIVNIDKLASRLVSEVGAGGQRRIIDDNRALEEWHGLLLELGEHRWDAEFLAAEWAQVILGQVVNSRTDYFKVRRAGRGRALTREERDSIWQLTERYTKRLEDQGVWTWRQIAERAARLELDRAGRIVDAANAEESSGSIPRYRYQHVVVDEAQDLSPAHWKMLRAMVAPGPNDMFLVGDTHQRIYDNYVTLGSLGINIRGRSARLTLSYRTTRQILHAALSLLTGTVYDDLDGGEEDLSGYRSLLRGGEPSFQGLGTWADERKHLVEQLRAWGPATDGSVAVCVPTRELVAEVVDLLAGAGIPAVEIGPDGPKSHDGVHVGTMHRFKGLEYQRIALAGISDGLVPRRGIESYRDSDPKRHQRERQRERSLLFVAATRARDELVVTWHGNPSPFLVVR